MTQREEAKPAASRAPRATADRSHAVPAEIRTVVVSRRTPPPSEPGERLHAKIVRGSMPRASVEALVLTDEDCGPDARGISNCRNALRLADGAMLVVRHPHDMQNVPCLTPGERVLVRPA
jgi:hypothetical protein